MESHDYPLRGRLARGEVRENTGDGVSTPKTGNNKMGTMRSKSLQGAVNRIPAALDAVKESKPLFMLGQAAAESIDNIAGALQEMDLGLAQRELSIREELTNHFNTALQTVATKIDAIPLPEVKMFDTIVASRDYSRGLQPFDCDSDSDFEAWLRRFTDLCSTCHPALTDDRKLAHFIANLVGRAREEVEKIPLANRTLDQVTEAVRALVHSPEQRALARQKLSSCRQETGESVLSFSKRLNRLVRSVMADKPDDTVKERLLDEFQDKQIGRAHV